MTFFIDFVRVSTPPVYKTNNVVESTSVTVRFEKGRRGTALKLVPKHLGVKYIIQQQHISNLTRFYLHHSIIQYMKTLSIFQFYIKA